MFVELEHSAGNAQCNLDANAGSSLCAQGAPSSWAAFGRRQHRTRDTFGLSNASRGLSDNCQRQKPITRRRRACVRPVQACGARADPGASCQRLEQTLIEQLNYAEIPRSFKNPAYGKKASNRRPKTAKQIIQIERERYFKPKKRGRGAVQARIDAANAAAAAAAAAEAAASAGTSVDGTPNEGTGRTTPVDGMDEDGANAAAAEEEQEPEVVRKEQYIACECITYRQKTCRNSTRFPPLRQTTSTKPLHHSSLRKSTAT